MIHHKILEASGDVFASKYRSKVVKHNNRENRFHLILEGEGI